MRELNTTAWLILRSCALGACLIGAGHSPVAASEWAQGQPDDFVIVDADLWSVPQQKVAIEDFEYRSEDPRPVVGRPDRVLESYPVLEDSMSLGIVSKRTRLVLRPVGSQDDPIDFRSDAGSTQNVRLSRDLRRVIFIRNGDLFRGEFDWGTGQVVNDTQVTQLGVLQPGVPMLWHGNIVLLPGNFDKDKPIVRIDLLSGDVVEMPDAGVFPASASQWGSSMFTNPSARYALRPEKEMIRVYDVRTDKVGQISLAHQFELNGQPRKGHLRTNMDGGMRWIDDDSAIFADDPAGVIARVDVDTGTLELLASTATPLKLKSVLPGQGLPDALILHKPDIRKVAEVTGRCVLNLNTGERTTISLPADADARWVSDRHAVYVVNDGGLSKVGTWVYDRESDRAVRITAMSASTHRLAYVPKHQMLYFGTSSGDKGTYGVRVDGQGLHKVSEEVELIAAFGPPVELGLSADAPPLWQPMPDVAPVAQAKDASPSVLVPGDLTSVLHALRDESPEVRDAAEKFYRRLDKSPINEWYDTSKLTMIMVEAYKADPTNEPHRIVSNANWGPALYRPGLVAYGAQTVRTTESRQLEAAELDAMATFVGESFADEMLANHSTGVSPNISTVETYLVRARRAYSDQQKAKDTKPTPDPVSADNKPKPQDAKEKEKEDSFSERTKKAIEDANKAFDIPGF